MTRPKPDQEVRPAPPGAILGLLGRGDYGRLRPRLRHLLRRLRVGTVVGMTRNTELTTALAAELKAESGTVLEHWKVIDEATHLIFLGPWASDILQRARATGKPVRVIERGRFLAPPGGWPKRLPRGPKLPSLEELERLDALEEPDWISPLCDPPLKWDPRQLGG